MISLVIMNVATDIPHTNDQFLKTPLLLLGKVKPAKQSKHYPKVNWDMCDYVFR